MIKLYSDADLSVPRVDTDFFTWSYLHGEAVKLNDVIMTKHSWEPCAADLFVAERNPREEEKHLVKEEFSVGWDRTSIKYGIDSIQELKSEALSSGKRRIVNMEMFAVECSFYGTTLIAFVMEKRIYELIGRGWGMTPIEAYNLLHTRDSEQYRIHEGVSRRGRVVVKCDKLRLSEYLEANKFFKNPVLNAWEHALSGEWM